MSKKLIHVEHKNFLTVPKNIKKCPKSVDKCDGSMVESGTQYHRQLWVNNNNGLQCSTVTLGPTFGVGVSQF